MFKIFLKKICKDLFMRYHAVYTEHILDFNRQDIYEVEA